MQTKLEPQDLDNSRLETYALCPQKYHNKYNLGLAEPKHLNTRFSTYMIHDPLTEWYWQGPGWRPTLEEWERRQALLAITPEEAAVKANAVYSVESAIKCFDFYTERFANDHERFDILGIENYLIDPGLGFGSKPDIRARERSNGKLWTLELKFSGWDFILEAATMNPQFLGQAYVTQGSGVLVTLVQPNGTKWSNFSATRMEIEPTPEELAEWRVSTEFKIANVRRSYAEGVWPKHTPNACTQYGGCYFLDLCTAGHPKGMLERFPRNDDALGYLTEGSKER